MLRYALYHFELLLSHLIDLLFVETNHISESTGFAGNTLSKVVNENGTLFLHCQQEEIRAITSSKTNRFVRNRCCLEFTSLLLWSNLGRCRDFMNSCQIYIKRCE